jgi:HD-GYP domain-containing protein (c-di-GMP phosphodiesterase class II)
MAADFSPSSERQTVALGDILTGLSQALDMTEGHPHGHAARSCLIGMRLADIIGLPEERRPDLFYALLLKDAGCSSNAARVHQLFGGANHHEKRSVWLRDWRSLSQESGYAYEYAGIGGTIWDRIAHLGNLAAAGPTGRRQMFQIRCERGASVALALGLSEATADAIRTMDEHWDGGGAPRGLRGEHIPLPGRIIGLAQVAEIFSHGRDASAALAVAERRDGRWFDPDLVHAFRTLADDSAFWEDLCTLDAHAMVAAAEPSQFAIIADAPRLDRICDAFAWLIDAKSPYTSEHSRRVAHIAVGIAGRLGFSAAEVVRLRRAALLHDIGKLGVPSNILDKPTQLTAEEWNVVRRHPAFTYQILNAVPVFRDFAFDAAAHHEKLDGSGYHRGYTGAQLGPAARVLAVADIADALLAERPYRRSLDSHEALRILQADAFGGQLCKQSVAAVEELVLSGQATLTAPASPALDAAVEHARLEPRARTGEIRVQRRA